MPGETWWYWGVLGLGFVVLAAGVCRERARGRLRGWGVWRAAALVHLGLVVGVAAGLAPTVLWTRWVGEDFGWPTVSEWAWWSGAGLAGLGGVWLVLWAVVGDPARGRRRCPRCWYDMSGVWGVGGLVCPECGRDSKSERRLGRTRRRWRWTGAGVGVCVLAAGMAAGPRIADGTWQRHVPDLALVIAWPWLPEGSGVQEEAGQRFLNLIDPWDEGWRRLVGSRARAGLRRDDRPFLLVYSISMLQPEHVDERTADRLLELTRHPHVEVRAQALNLIWPLVPDAGRVLPAAVKNLNDPNRQVVQGALNAILACGRDSAGGIAAPPELLELARSSPRLAARGHALRALGATRPTDETMEILHAAAGAPDLWLRAAALGAIARRDPDRGRAESVLLRGRDDADLDVRMAALAAIAKDGPYTDATLAAIARVSGEELSHYAGRGLLYDLARSPLLLERRLDVLRRVSAARPVTDTDAVVRCAVMAMEGEEREAAALFAAWEKRAEADGDERTARWCQRALAWVGEAERMRAKAGGD